ncbi:MAG: hypothetical protein ACD_80C00038G0002 [uncultured bacterium (gcode 4)]|uniref:Uncharacterized protein n=1 Tax=uncultured bacterium (gcode 4) TaxID=1234023 RepID=K1XYW1_9BACT|nr:MAG: hypothetical protein ACD_80C00038G0002 [uncultured bacterium (gcode 4)]
MIDKQNIFERSNAFVKKENPIEDKNIGIQPQKKNFRDRLSDALNPITWWLAAAIPFLLSTSFNDIANTKLLEKPEQKTYIPYIAPEISDSIWFHTNIFSKTIKDIILKKWWLKEMPDSINYTVAWQKKQMDISEYVNSLENDSLFLSKNLGNDLTDASKSISAYCAQDYYRYKSLLQKISLEWVGIETNDSYRDKVSKIQKFVNSFEYENDILYLGKNGTLSAMSDYQLPFLANILVGKMDCNNKAWLFVELCRVNNIISGIWLSSTHASPAVFSDSKDEMWKYLSPNVSIDKPSWGFYNGIIVEPTWNMIINWQKELLLAWDTDNKAYIWMAFTIFWPK